MVIDNTSLQVGKKFYFFEYFYILLVSVRKGNNREQIFNSFKELKRQFNLGDSKYKKLTVDEETMTPRRQNNYEYTFQRVIVESSNYKLIVTNNNHISLTERGEEALEIYNNKGKLLFNNFIFQFMEGKSWVIRKLISKCYELNKPKNGLLIFPVYSPRKLGFEKSKMSRNYHILEYSQKLTMRLEDDLRKNLHKEIDLSGHRDTLLRILVSEKYITSTNNDYFDLSKYNAIVTKFRKYWIDFFLKKIYGFKYSFATFNVWVERGKQLGLIHTSDFYPGFDGRIVYPTSIMGNGISHRDFKVVMKYSDGESLYRHSPKWEITDNDNQIGKTQESFVKALVDSYYDMRAIKRTHFIRLADLREKVCYKLKIANYMFDEFLEKTYLMSFKNPNLLKIKISLEADRLPHETNAIYMKREPVLVNGKYKNIIAINY